MRSPVVTSLLLFTLGVALILATTYALNAGAWV
jgi:hypothetical protein